MGKDAKVRETFYGDYVQYTESFDKSKGNHTTNSFIGINLNINRNKNNNNSKNHTQRPITNKAANENKQAGIFCNQLFSYFLFFAFSLSPGFPS